MRRLASKIADLGLVQGGGIYTYVPEGITAVIALATFTNAIIAALEKGAALDASESK